MRPVDKSQQTLSMRAFGAIALAVVGGVVALVLLRPAAPKPAPPPVAAAPAEEGDEDDADDEELDEGPDDVEEERLRGELVYDAERGVFRLTNHLGEVKIFRPSEVRRVSASEVDPDGARVLHLPGDQVVEANVALLRQLPRADLYRLDYTLSDNVETTADLQPAPASMDDQPF